jgi:hypothetical protein
MCTRFAKLGEGPIEAPRSKHELRNGAHAYLHVEARILDDVLGRRSARCGVVVSQIKPAIGVRLGKVIALSSMYWMLARMAGAAGSSARQGSGKTGPHGESGRRRPARAEQGNDDDCCGADAGRSNWHRACGAAGLDNLQVGLGLRDWPGDD